MKLNTSLVQRTLDEFEAQAIPDNHPAVPQLSQIFGDHTFFLNASGLHVVEPVEAGESDPASGEVVKIAGWTDANRSSLKPHDPQPTSVVIPFKAKNSAA